MVPCRKPCPSLYRKPEKFIPIIRPRDATKPRTPTILPRVLGVETSVNNAAQPTSDIDQKNSRSDSPMMSDKPAAKLACASIKDLWIRKTTKYASAAIDSPAIINLVLSRCRSDILPHSRFWPNAEATMSSVPNNAVNVTVCIRP